MLFLAKFRIFTFLMVAMNFLVMLTILLSEKSTSVLSFDTPIGTTQKVFLEQSVFTRARSGDVFEHRQLDGHSRE